MTRAAGPIIRESEALAEGFSPAEGTGRSGEEIDAPEALGCLGDVKLG